MENDVILLLILTLLGHSTVAYTTVWYIFKRKASELIEATKPERMVAMIKAMLQVREADDKPTFLEEILGVFGQYIGRYLSGMMGRTSRQGQNAAFDLAGLANPALGMILNQPGVKKFLNNPMVKPFADKLIAQMAGEQQPPAEAPPQ